MRRAEIEDRAALIDTEDYFKVLGVSDDASPEALRSAYFALAKSFHPDRLPAQLADLRPIAAHVFARITEAYRTLSDPARRLEYAANRDARRPPRSDREVVTRVVDAALEFQKAEVLLKKNDLAGAEELARRALEGDPEQPEYIALLVWIQAQRRSAPPPLSEGAVTTHYDDLIKQLDTVLTKEPRFERALFYRGTLQKRAGRSDKAFLDFRLVAEINPRNIDAAREVRLHEMRTRGEAGSSTKGARPRGPNDGGPEGPPGGGLLNKLFKR